MKKSERAENKNKKIIIVLIIAIAVLALVGIMLFLRSSSTKEEKVDTFFDYPKDQIKKIKVCKNSSDCMFPDDVFNYLTVKDQYTGLNESIKMINKETEDYYNQVKNSDLSSDECSAVRNKYTKGLYVENVFINYSNDKYISINTKRTITNLCTMKITRPQVKVYLYDIKADKMITQDEFIERENITDEEIKTAIDKMNEILKKDGEVIGDVDYSDIVLFYGYQGDIGVSYRFVDDDMYFDATVREK